MTLNAVQPHVLTTSRIYETGVKHLFWNERAEWTFSAFDIERRNVFTSRSGHLFNVAGKVHSQGVEWAGAIRPLREWKLWGNIAFVNAEYVDFIDSVNGISFAGNTPPNVPRIVVNAKCQRPGVCNAAESLLVHAAVADAFLPRVGAALAAQGI